MKAVFLPVFLPVLILSCALAPGASAQSCREVVRDASGRIVQTIERQKQAGGSQQGEVLPFAAVLAGIGLLVLRATRVVAQPKADTPE